MAIGTAALIGLGISAASGAYSAHKQGQIANRAANAQDAAAAKQSGMADQQAALAKQMTGFAGKQFSASEPALNKAMNYYQTLAAGDRGAVSGALAPARAQMAEGYKGAQRGLEASMAPGPQRDRAIAEMSRQKAGQAGMMPFMAQQNAVGNLASMGDNAANRGMSLMGGAGNAFSGAGGMLSSMGNMADLAGQNRMAGVNGWQQMGKTMFDFYAPYLMGGSGGTKPLKSTQTVPNYTAWMPR